MTLPQKPRTSLLRGDYLARNVLANFALRALDCALRGYVRLSGVATPGVARNPRRILIANGASLGDVVLSTAVLPALRARFPQAQIGMIVGSWSRAIVESHAAITWIHVVDHWRLSRSQASLITRWRRYRASRSAALKEIRAVGYDVAIDLYYFFPNSILLLYQAAIPMRVGYVSAGFGPLLSHPKRWALRDCSILEYHAQLLRELGLSGTELAEMRPNLPVGSPRRVRPERGRDVVIVHIGTGDGYKEWPADCWRELTLALKDAGWEVCFTGAGTREQKAIEAVIGGIDGCVNLCGKLSWSNFVETIAAARLVIGVDSVACHVAASVGTASIVISHGVNNPLHWKPPSTDCLVVSHPVPCAPCYRKRGCKDMTCIRQVGVAEVLGAVRSLIQGQLAPRKSLP